jgi:hypothetical protein
MTVPDIKPWREVAEHLWAELSQWHYEGCELDESCNCQEQSAELMRGAREQDNQ